MVGRLFLDGFFMGLLRGVWKRGLGDRKHGTHSSLQPLKRRLIRFRRSGNLRARLQ